MTPLPQKLEEWLKQPEAFVTDAERRFVAMVRTSRADGVGYGWMQQLIEWEWQENAQPPGSAWGPEYFNARIRWLEQELTAMTKAQAVASTAAETTETTGPPAEPT